MRCVYTTGSSKPRQPIAKPAPKVASAGVTSGFFSSLFSSFTGAPSRSPTPAIETPVASHEELAVKEIEARKKLQQINETSVLLSIFGADMTVNVDDRLRRELLRATKKNPPGRMRLELIYVCNFLRAYRFLTSSSQRPERMSMMPVGRKMRGSRKQRGVYSKG